MQFDALGMSGIRRLCASVALTDQRDTLAGGVLDRLGKMTDSGPVIVVGRGDTQGRQMAERVDGRVKPRSPGAVDAILAEAWAAFGRRTSNARSRCVDDRRCGSGDTPSRQPQLGSKVVCKGGSSQMPASAVTADTPRPPVADRAATPPTLCRGGLHGTAH